MNSINPAIIIIFIFLIFVVIFVNTENTGNSNRENFINQSRQSPPNNVNINSMKRITVTNSNLIPSKSVSNYQIKKKAAVNADKEKFTIKYPLKYNNFINMKKNKIAQCISAVEESYDYPDSDIDSYIKKTEIPICPNYPNMNQYIKKTEIPDCQQCPDMDLYIKKTEIPKCPNMNLYIKKTEIPRLTIPRRTIPRRTIPRRTRPIRLPMHFNVKPYRPHIDYKKIGHLNF